MIVKVKEEECPYCNQSAQIVHIKTPNLEVCQCDACQKVWMIFNDRIERMIRFKENGPDTNDEDQLCPICWRILEPNYQTWQLECKDPTCGYSKRLLDLSGPQRNTKKRYLELRTKIFEYGSRKEIPPAEITDEYIRLKVEYNKVKKFDLTPIK